MIDVYTTRIEACDEDKNVLFILEMEDQYCCTLQIKNHLHLNNHNLEQVLTAVRRAVNMLGLED